ncbi:MAG: T9SS type A sorting domain-containing protein [Ignavibacteria bacterium]|nr:T9SS type A sorting domain-containing protein [Ignavibacteria bacterium]
MKNKILLLTSVLFLFILKSNDIYSQDTVKVMTYNLLNYNGSVVKDNSFRKIVKYSNPDILVAEEVISQSAVNNMLGNVMNFYTPGLYSAGTFFNGFDTDNAIYYKSSKFTFLYNFVIQTTLRTINLFGLVHNETGLTIKLLAVHLKASNSTSDQQQRLSEVNALRSFTNSLPNGDEFAVLGDFNIYTSTEPAYQRLLQTEVGSEGHFIDPLNLSGTWNQSSYAPFHTQSSRIRALSDSGSTGGLDDRFDMILNSKGMTEEGGIKYIPGSLKPLGNDGNHYNDSINQRPNTSVPDSIADAIYYGSDHLPVTALYKFEKTGSVTIISNLIPEKFNVYQNYPNPFNPSTKIKFDIPSGLNGSDSKVRLSVYNSLGKEIAELVNENLGAGSYETEFDASDFSSGVYFYKIETDNFSQTKSMFLIK